MAELMQSIGRYWTRRAPSYTDVIKKNLADGWDKVWADELTAHFPRDTRRVLDIGTGPGFFAMILARRGYAVTAVDYSDGMLREARRNAGDLARHIRFARMDAQRLDLTDGSFDAIVTRNLTWNLEDPEQAYKEWMRVLKPGGVLLNFDANYGAVDFTDTSDLPKNHAHNQIENTLMQECEDIKRQLSISNYARPAWDLEALSSSGVQQFQIDMGVSQRVYMEKNAFYNPTPLFAVCGKKGDL